MNEEKIERKTPPGFNPTPTLKTCARCRCCEHIGIMNYKCTKYSFYMWVDEGVCDTWEWGRKD